MCVKIIQQLTSKNLSGFFFIMVFCFRFLHRHSGFASGHYNGTVAIEFHPKIEKKEHIKHHQMSNIVEKTKSRVINL